ncbi:hypothetical protein ACZ87_03054 [Candidatus Erwinia dacicola]|uniref:Uncharacterized protein n=1 Tax=Candidatus Erwinia dacicola TaxID=252393 RepID=A0A328TQW3_9GAMM|nr:hypothetical protein ACZ87_03054 [Candidatus Erwinia dacicola]
MQLISATVLPVVTTSSSKAIWRPRTSVASKMRRADFFAGDAVIFQPSPSLAHAADIGTVFNGPACGRYPLTDYNHAAMPGDNAAERSAAGRGASARSPAAAVNSIAVLNAPALPPVRCRDKTSGDSPAG